MIVLTTCQQEAPASVSTYHPHEALVLRDVAYGKDSLQKLDAYLPEGRSAQTPSLVLIHGGSWNGGSKKDFTAHIDSLKKRLPGYAIFNLDYRLYNGGNTFPAQENDIQSALQYIASKKEEWSIDENRIVLLGASAGGHLALLQAYKYQEPRIAGVIDFFGPTDLTAMYSDPWHPYIPYALQMVTGTSPKLNQDLYHQSSPINFVSSQSAPTLILHGANDPVVHISQSKSLKKKLEKAGVAHELIVYPGQRHGWFGSTLSHSFDQVEKFLEKHIR